jgi:hypothetical protein
LSLYDPDSYRDHIVKVQNTQFFEESPASYLSTNTVGF